MRVTMAQTNPVFGDVQENLENMITLIYQYKNETDLIVFPELSLTGYLLKEKVYDLAITIGSQEIKQICEVSRETGINVMFGFIENGKGTRVYNSSVFIKDGEVSSIQRKIYPTTYGIFEEGKYFARGKKVKVDELQDFTSSMLICNDLWHPSLPHIAAHKHCSLLVCLINSPEGGLGSTYSSSIGWERLGQFYAGIYGCYVIIVNRVGEEEDKSFYGNSKVIDPYGQVVDQCPFNDESTQTCEIDYSKVKEIRKILPIMRDEDVDLTIRHYQEIASQENAD